MKWRTMTADELAIFNAFIINEPVELMNTADFKRYARRKGEKDMLVQFEAGVVFRLLKVEAVTELVGGDVATIQTLDGQVRKMRRGGTEETCYYLTFYEPHQQLFMKLSDSDFARLFSDECEEVLDSTALYAIKQHNRSEVTDVDTDETFGSF